MNNQAKEFKEMIDSIVDTRITKKGITSYIAAVVTNVNDNGSIDVFLPPDTKNIIHGLLNKTGEVLVSGDAVEICTKNGKLSNAWVAIKHGTNNSGHGSGVIVDYNLSNTSTNPVQNKVITQALNKKLTVNGWLDENNQLIPTTDTTTPRYAAYVDDGTLDGIGLITSNAGTYLLNTINTKVDTSTFNQAIEAANTVLANKQDKLTAGNNITIVDNVISSMGGGENKVVLYENSTLLQGTQTTTINVTGCSSLKIYAYLDRTQCIFDLDLESSFTPTGQLDTSVPITSTGVAQEYLSSRYETHSINVGVSANTGVVTFKVINCGYTYNSTSAQRNNNSSYGVYKIVGIKDNVSTSTLNEVNQTLSSIENGKY